MLKDGMHTCDRCGMSTSSAECVNPHCRVAQMEESLAAVTAERDALKADNDAHIAVRDKVRAALGCEPHEGLSDASQRVVAERDALAAELAALKYSDSTLIISPMIPVTSSTGQPELFEYDRMKRELAALKKRVADAPRKMLYPRDEGEKTEWVAHVRLEAGE